MSLFDKFSIQTIRVVLPSAITGSAILAGYISILETFQGEYVIAAGFIILACLLDMLDGGVARIMKATSEFGEQFDSLADMVNYGVAPALMFYFLYFQEWGFVGTILSFLPVCCAGVRLARFNVAADPDIPIKYFIGLPTTIAALVLAGFVIFTSEINLDASYYAAFLVVTTALLMVSSIHYEKGNILSLRYILKTRRILTGLLIVVSLIMFPTIAFFVWGLLYILYGLIRSIVRIILHGDDEAAEAEIDVEI